VRTRLQTPYALLSFFSAFSLDLGTLCCASLVRPSGCSGDLTWYVAYSMGNYVCACFGVEDSTDHCWKARRAVDLHSEVESDLDSITTSKLKEIGQNLASIWKGDVPKKLQTKDEDEKGHGTNAGAPNETHGLSMDASTSDVLLDSLSAKHRKFLLSS
jgi:hypothetical protein